MIKNYRLPNDTTWPMPLDDDATECVPGSNLRQPRNGAARRQAIAKRDGWSCCWCEVALTPDDATIEHLKPRSKGGTDGTSNLRLACFACNQARGSDDLPPGWAPKKVVWP